MDGLAGRRRPLLFMPHCAIRSSALESPAPSTHTHTSALLQVSSPDTSVAPSRRREIARTAMDWVSLITDHNLQLHSRGMFDGRADTSMFAADGYAGVRIKDEHKNKGKDLFFCDLPELGGFDDFETNMRHFDPTFEMGNNYFDDTLWSSICSPDAQLVPSSCFDSINVSGVRNQSTTDTVIQSSVSVPDQNNMAHSTNMQQQTWSDGRNHIPSSYEAHASSSGEIDQFSQHIDAELFGPFRDDISSGKQTGGCEGLEAIICSHRDMQVPTASSTMLRDESVATSATCSGPDLVAARIPCSKRKLNDPLHGTPDMLLEGMAENPLEMYFPPLTTFEQPEVLMSDTSTQTYQFPEEFAGSTSATNHASMQFCSKMMSSAKLREQPRSTVILEAVPVKDFSFEKLQNGMNQMDVATKGRIRDALYRLANSVEQRHYGARTSGLVGSSGSKRFRSGRWTETQTNPMDQSVAQLLLQKPPYRNTVSPSCVTL
ncbi:hypothetical protein EJB05_20074 [Eragrostis curvula]|uniref:Uncharacterized protein n=1 Tax=Eragrostis curvula TaxID=38414 RepID=A0A5J9UXC3_9POAL|nr:hypothetical protein EJB05_20074 [Eragrostis curvula]